MKLTSALTIASLMMVQSVMVDAHPWGASSTRGELHNSKRGFRNFGQQKQGGFHNVGNTAQKSTSKSAEKQTTSSSAAASTAKAGGKADIKETADATTSSTADVSASTTAAAVASTTTAASSGSGGDLQTSLTLDSALIGSNLAANGLAAEEPGQVASLTSTNNFINFCASVNQPITNGEQVTGGSCNPVPMGSIPAKTAMPSCKFTFPTNGGTVTANQNFTVTMAVSNLDTGNFVNADTNYFGAPQQLNAQGIIVAHSHVVIEKLTALDQTTTTDPTVFAFFKGLNEPAVDGILSAVVTGGLPAGFYKVSSINTSANHAPVLGPIAQHGSFDDVVYFTAK